MRNIKVRWVREHYEIYVDGKFRCSCDTIEEVTDELVKIEQEDE